MRQVVWNAISAPSPLVALMVMSCNGITSSVKFTAANSLFLSHLNQGQRPFPFPFTFSYNPAVETILLQTKLYIPSLRPSLVPRPHLIAQLDRGRAGKLILLSAPAGYGKTTLVTEWIAQIQKETAVCWLSLDEDDSDPHQFFVSIQV